MKKLLKKIIWRLLKDDVVVFSKEIHISDVTSATTALPHAYEEIVIHSIAKDVVREIEKAGCIEVKRRYNDKLKGTAFFVRVTLLKP